MQKLLALLVESGAIYCSIWVRFSYFWLVYEPQADDANQSHSQVVIVAFQIRYYRLAIGTIPTISSFLDVFNVFMTGALVPAIVRPL